jgi:peptidoglycan hydrolase-like protein with peptidoglycan-binding domain
MKKLEQNKAIGYVGGGLVLFFLSYLVYNVLIKTPKTFGELATDVKDTILNVPSSMSSWATQSYIDSTFPLKKGSGGSNVEKLQSFLNGSGGYGLVIDGKFGNKTENAVIEEQKPFESFKKMYPNSIKGQVTQAYFNSFVN